MIMAARTDSGLVRENNEDTCFISKEPLGTFDSVMILADGMGGHAYGEVASGVAVSAMVSYLKKVSLDIPHHQIDEAFSHANLEVLKKADELDVEGIGTTLVLVGFIDRQVYIGSIGDSRAYLLNAKHGTIRPITTDHTKAEELVARGLVMRGSHEYDKYTNELVKAIGFSAEVIPDYFDFKLYEGDLILICSDGLYNMVDAKTMRLLSTDTSFDLKRRVDTLVQEANRNGGFDNITVVLADPEVKNG